MNPLKTLFQRLLHRWRVHSHVTLCTCDDIMPKDCLIQPRVVWWSRCKSLLFSKSYVYFFQAPIPIGLQRGKTLPFSMSGFFLQLIGLFLYHICKSISYISIFPAYNPHTVCNKCRSPLVRGSVRGLSGGREGWAGSYSGPRSCVCWRLSGSQASGPAVEPTLCPLDFESHSNYAAPAWGTSTGPPALKAQTQTISRSLMYLKNTLPLKTEETFWSNFTEEQQYIPLNHSPGKRMTWPLTKTPPTEHFYCSLSTSHNVCVNHRCNSAILALSLTNQVSAML